MSTNYVKYYVFVHDFENKWDCVAQFNTYGEAVECSDKYIKYGEVHILANVSDSAKVVFLEDENTRLKTEVEELFEAFKAVYK